MRQLAIILITLLSLGRPAAAQDSASFVGGAACAECHRPQTALWTQSHHAKAMQPATPANVLGDFNNAEVTYFGVTTRFFRKGEAFMLRTEGSDGAMADFEIAYTLGVAPLQQYLVPMPGGRLQAFGIAWDARPKQAGGQRWFHLYPDQKLPPGDRLHWTGRDQTWNFMCADCHTTNLAKGFDLANNSYATHWTDSHVSCEACHGPGSRHVAWAQARASGQPGLSEDLRMGIVNWLRDSDGGRWEMQPQTGIARRSPPRSSAVQVDTCAGCHALRGTLTPPPPAGTPFLQAFVPTLLEQGAFHADGQIDGETFEYGAFLQSRMHRAGVVCADCHEPHGGKLRADGNAICAGCHLSERFDATAHHHHEPGSAGAQCANCHMPQKTYMGVHVRHDHGFRVPRPDLSVRIGVPNACTQCHEGKQPDWAASAVASWYPAGRQTRGQFGLALRAGQIRAPDAERLLDALIMDRAQPAIARATALEMLPGIATGASLPAWRAAITDPDPLARMGAARAMPPAASTPMLRDLSPLLADPVRAVRVEAARALAGMVNSIPPANRPAFDAALAELIAAEMTASDRPETHVNLGLLYARLGRAAEATAAYQTALRLDPHFVQAMLNLADLDRALGREAQAMDWLRKAVAAEPANADIQHGLGLALVRARHLPEALVSLRRAVELAPENARYAYVLAIALNSTGRTPDALALLQQTHKAVPGDRDVLVALATISRDSGDLPAAIGYARQLVAMNPADPSMQSLLRSLEQIRDRQQSGAPARP